MKTQIRKNKNILIISESESYRGKNINWATWDILQEIELGDRLNRKWDMDLFCTYYPSNPVWKCSAENSFTYMIEYNGKLNKDDIELDPWNRPFSKWILNNQKWEDSDKIYDWKHLGNFYTDYTQKFVIPSYKRPVSVKGKYVWVHYYGKKQKSKNGRK
jgi:hypothetical protein